VRHTQANASLSNFWQRVAMQSSITAAKALPQQLLAACYHAV